MPTGLTKDAGWEIGVSKTLQYPTEIVWDLIARRPDLWLAEGAILPTAKGKPWTAPDGVHGEIRTYGVGNRIRLTHKPADGSPESTIQVALSVTPTGTILRFHQERLSDEAARERQRTHWQSVMARIEDALERDT